MIINAYKNIQTFKNMMSYVPKKVTAIFSPPLSAVLYYLYLTHVGGPNHYGAIPVVV